MDACLMLADSSLLTVVTGIVTVALALGFVIFVHELGHFAVAKMCGVQCDKFMIGFDIGGYKLSRKWGETEYGIGILPLGGYVKMLGQDDDPSKIAEQMKQSEQAAEGFDESQTKEVTGPSGEKYRVDRRSYLAKSVPQRMAIISAGVIMNLIFGYLFAVLAFGMGVDYMPCVVGQAAPGAPAYMAGLETGDEILRINDRVNPSFEHLTQSVVLGDLENGVNFRVRKASTGEEVELQIKPELTENGAKIGVTSPSTNVLRDKTPILPGSAAAGVGFEQGDRIVAINKAPISDFRDFEAALAKRVDESIDVTVERKADDGSSEQVTLTTPPSPFRRMGIVLGMGPITAVQPNSPAAEAGLKQGDLITSINGRAVGVSEQNGMSTWDPLTLPYMLPSEEGELILTVQRGDESLDVNATPREVDWIEEPIGLNSPLSLPSLGVCYKVGHKVLTTVEGTDAAKELRPGDVFVSARIIPPGDGSTTGLLNPIEFNAETDNWGAFVRVLQLWPQGAKVALKCKRQDATKTVTLVPIVSEGVYVPSRGFNLMPLLRQREVSGLGEAASLAWDRMRNDMGMIFGVLSKLGSDQVPVSNLAGPVGILQMAYRAATLGVAPLLLFLTMLSANLAVLNALPIPVLDGGHMVFLGYEGLRGRPANEKVVISLHMVGFVLLVGLMVFVLTNDIGRLMGT